MRDKSKDEEEEKKKENDKESKDKTKKKKSKSSEVNKEEEKLNSELNVALENQTEITQQTLIDEESKTQTNEDKPKEKTETKTLNKFIQLKNIDLTVKKGDFVCVIGDVGSGKSSLLNAIIGDMIFVP